MFNAALFDELAPLYPDSSPNDGVAEYTVAAAGGSYAGVHIMLDGLTPGIPVTLHISGGEKEYPFEWKLFELIPLPVEVNSSADERTEWLDGSHNDDVIRRAPFSVYDVLRPCTNIITPKGVSAALAFRCMVRGEKSAIHSWKIELRHGQQSKTLNFKVEEYPVKVPAADRHAHKYVNWVGESVITNFHNVPLYSEEWYKYLEEYLKLLHYGRQNMLCIWPEWMFDGNGSDRPIFNEERFDRILSIAERAGIYWLNGGTLTTRKDNNWEAATVAVKFCNREIPGDGEKILAEMCEILYAQIKKRGLEKRWCQSFMDEPEDIQAEVYRLGCSILKKTMPDIQIFEATLTTKSIEDTVDIWCPVTRTFEKNREFFDERIKKGDRVFVYTCLQPAGKYCNRMLDMEHLRQVWIGWAAAKYKEVEGFLHWGGCFIPDGIDPYYLPERIGPCYDYEHDRHVVLPAGDTAIIYPGFHSVYPTVRLESHRIGFEDLELLRVAEKKAPIEAEELLNSVFRDYTDYEKDISSYRNARKKLFELCCK